MIDHFKIVSAVCSDSSGAKFVLFSDVKLGSLNLCIYRLVLLLLSALAVYMPGATFIAPGFVLYIFTNVGIYSFVVPTGRNITVDLLIVAGGGGGGAGAGGISIFYY